jgi:hypothetical protein
MRSIRRRLNSDEWPNLSELESINDKLAKVTAEIKHEADGRVCGSCKHMRARWCSTKRNVDGNDLAVFYPHAIACGQHEVMT